MSKKHLVLPLLILLTGCDKLCSSEVIDQVKIQNLTARDLHLEICKGKAYGTQEIDIPLHLDAAFTLGTRQEGYAKRGASSMSSCDRPSGTVVRMGIALTSRSFNDVRLCYRDASGADVLLIEHFDTCPAGTVEQVQPVDQCGN